MFIRLSSGGRQALRPLAGDFTSPVPESVHARQRILRNITHKNGGQKLWPPFLPLLVYNVLVVLRRRKLLLGLSLCAVFLGTVFAVALSYKRPPVIRPVPDTDPRDRPEYQWAEGDDDATLGVRSDATRITAVSLDRATRTLVPLPALAKALTALRPLVRTGKHWTLADPDNVILLPSPDNRWVLMYDAAHDPPIRRVDAVRADGKQTVSMTMVDPTARIAWLSDSRRWEEVTKSAYVLHDIAVPRTLVRLPVKVLATPQAPITTLYDPKTPKAGILLLPTGGWVNTYWSPDDGEPAIFWRANVEHDAVIVRPVGIVIPPKEMEYVQIELSPKGDQVAWTATRTPPHAPTSVVKLLALVPPVQRLLAPIVSPPDESVVWVTRLDGSDMRQVSVEPCIGGQVPAYNPYDWSTDGKRFLVTETKSGKPYAVPVP